MLQTCLQMRLVDILFVFLLVRDSVQGPDEERLIDDLLNKKKYNKLARPVHREADSLEVRFGISLQSIVNVDEKNEMLLTNMWLNYEWKDYKLQWNESEYGGIKSIRLPSKNIGPLT